METFLNAPSAKPVDHWITIDRDPHIPTASRGCYEEVKDAFWAAIEQGKTPGLRTEGTGTTSADCPLTAVGNVAYNGNNPPKYRRWLLQPRRDPQRRRRMAGRAGRRRGWRQARGSPWWRGLTVTNLGRAAWLPLAEPLKAASA